MNKEEKLAKAIAFAAEKHANQKRKDGTPYIFHPLEVAELLKRYDYDIDYQVAGVLHDVLEDTDAIDEEVKAFEENVYEAVKLVTRQKGADEAEYVKNILTNRMAAAVKNADKIHNMCDIVTTNNRDAILNYAKKRKNITKKNSHMHWIMQSVTRCMRVNFVILEKKRDAAFLITRWRK